jgi:hypothetical protein
MKPANACHIPDGGLRVVGSFHLMCATCICQRGRATDILGGTLRILSGVSHKAEAPGPAHVNRILVCYHIIPLRCFVVISNGMVMNRECDLIDFLNRGVGFGGAELNVDMRWRS